MKQILYIGNELAARGGTPTSIDVLAPLLREEGFEVKTASANPGKLQRLKEMLYLVIRNRKTADFVLIDTYSTQNFWYAVTVGMLCRQFRLKYIPILHGGELPKRLDRSGSTATKFFQQAFLNVAPSQYIMAEFESRGIRNLEYIPNSISVSDYHFKERKKLQPRLLWIRSFAEVYNPLLALHVLEILLLKFPRAELCMLGPDKNGSMQGCKDLAENKKLPVRFMGKVSKKFLVQIAAEYDIFLNTTNADNTPVSVIEAMALGLPVVSTDVGGMPFLIQHKEDGLLVSPRDAVKMAQAVEQMLEAPIEAQQMAFNARKKVEAFDWELVKEEWKAVLSSTGVML